MGMARFVFRIQSLGFPHSHLNWKKSQRGKLYVHTACSVLYLRTLDTALEERRHELIQPERCTPVSDIPGAHFFSARGGLVVAAASVSVEIAL